MDPIQNPFAPGAGTRPPELAGRDDVLEAARIALGRTRIGRASKSTLMVGLRGRRQDGAAGPDAGRRRGAGNACAGGGSAGDSLVAVHPGAAAAPSPASAFSQRIRATAGATRAARACGVRLGPQSEVPGHRGWSGPGTRAWAGGQRGPGDRFAGPSTGRRRGGQGGRGLRGVVYRRASVRGRGPACSPDYGATPSIPASTSRDDDWRRAAAGARTHGTGQVVRRTAVRVPGDRRFIAR